MTPFSPTHLSRDIQNHSKIFARPKILAKFYYCKTLHPTKSRYGALDFNWIEFMFLNFHNFVWNEFYELSKMRWNTLTYAIISFFFVSSSKPLFDSTTGIVAITRKLLKWYYYQIIIKIIYFYKKKYFFVWNGSILWLKIRVYFQN